MSKKGGFFPSKRTEERQGFRLPSWTVSVDRNHDVFSLLLYLIIKFLIMETERSLRIHKPVRMSLALEEADPIGFVAVQEYWPANLRSVLKMLRVATLSKNDVCTFGSSFNGLPSLCQDTEMGSDPLMAHSNTTGSPTVSWTSLNCRENDGGSFCSVGIESN